MAKNLRTDRAKRRKARVRGKVFGTTQRPRLTVNKSLRNITAQIIDDEKMITLVAVSSLSKGSIEKISGKNKTDVAAIIGEEIAKRAIDKNIKQIVFDRNRNLYHGRIKSLAEAARKAGLEF